jgi:thymidylate synthase
MEGLSLEYIQARDLPDAWFQCIYNILEKGHEYTIERGSFKGQKRLEYDYIVIHIKFPSTRPLIPDIPPGVGVPPPTDMEYVESYLEKLITSNKSKLESYTYGEDLEKQISEIIRMYREDGFNTNQAYMAVGNAASLFLDDPQCLRGIDTRIRYGKLHFMPYFRSWDLWAGFPSNLAAIQLVKEYMAKEIGVEDGEIIAASKGLHIYDYCWDLARARVGKSTPQK